MKSDRLYLIALGFILGFNLLLFYYLQLATGYNSPTTVYAKIILAESRVGSVPYDPTPDIWSWRGTLYWEYRYPEPALLEAVLSSVTGIDPSYTFILPILASNIIFPFVWARILGRKNGFALGYAAMLAVEHFAGVTTISRHTFGEYLLYALLVPVFMLMSGKTKRVRELLAVITIFLIAISFSHEGFLGFATGGLLGIFLLSTLSALRKKSDSRLRVFSGVCFFSIFLFFFVNPFIEHVGGWAFVPRSLEELVLQLQTAFSAVIKHNILQVPYEGGSLLLNPPRPEQYNWVSHYIVATNTLFALGAIVIAAACVGRIAHGKSDRALLTTPAYIAFFTVGTMVFDALTYSLVFLTIPLGLASIVGPLLLPTAPSIRQEIKDASNLKLSRASLRRGFSVLVLCSLTISGAFMISGVFIFGSGASYPFEAFATVPVSHFLATHANSLKLMGTADSTSKIFLNLPLDKISEVDTIRYGTQVYLLRLGISQNQSDLNQVFSETGADSWLLTRSEFHHVVWGEVAGQPVAPFPRYDTISNDTKLNLVYDSYDVSLFLLLP